MLKRFPFLAALLAAATGVAGAAQNGAVPNQQNEMVSLSALQKRVEQLERQNAELSAQMKKLARHTHSFEVPQIEYGVEQIRTFVQQLQSNLTDSSWQNGYIVTSQSAPPHVMALAGKTGRPVTQ